MGIIMHNDIKIDRDRLNGSIDDEKGYSKIEPDLEVGASKKRFYFFIIFILIVFIITGLGYFDLKKKIDKVSSDGNIYVENIKKSSYDLTSSISNISAELESFDKEIKSLKKEYGDIIRENANTLKKISLKADKKDIENFEPKVADIEKSLKSSIEKNTSNIEKLLKQKPANENINEKIDGLKKEFQLQIIKSTADMKTLISSSESKTNLSIDNKISSITNSFDKNLKQCLNKIGALETKISEIQLKLAKKGNADNNISEQEIGK